MTTLIAFATIATDTTDTSAGPQRTSHPASPETDGGSSLPPSWSASQS